MMSDSLSEADKVMSVFLVKQFDSNLSKIRSKRLAKLGGQASSTGAASAEKRSDGASISPSAGKPVPQPSAHSEEKEQLTPKINMSKPSDASLSTSNPFSQLGMMANGKGGISVTPTIGRQITPMKRDRLSASGTFGPKLGESAEAWENRILSNIFRLTLDPAVGQDSQGNHLHFVAGVRSDLEEENRTAILTAAVLDQAILEAASHLEEHVTPLDYLLGCWKRVIRHLKTWKGATVEDSRSQVLKEAKRLCMSYCIFAVTIPEMFG